MNATILNRDFEHPADGWYQIEPRGEHANRAAGIVQVIDDAATQAIVNRFNADAEKPGFAGMLVDHEHFKHDQDKESRAYGWLMKLQNRADGIYGQVRWTQTGKAAVDGGDYRFFSTEYDPADLKVLNSGKVRKVRPLRLDGLTLTNSPNNKGGRPITNRDPKQFRQSADADPADEANNQRKPMKSVCSALGLSADASEEAVLGEVTKVINRATKAEGELTPVKNRVTALETENTTLLDEQIAADLDAKGIKDEKVRNKLLPVLKTLKNRAERIEFLTDVVGKPAAAAPAAQRKLFNRDAKAPEGGDSGTVDEAARAQKADAEIRDYKVRNRCSYTEARTVIRSQKPELFVSAGAASE